MVHDYTVLWSHRSPAPAPWGRAQEHALRLLRLYCLNAIHRFLIQCKDSLPNYWGLSTPGRKGNINPALTPLTKTCKEINLSAHSSSDTAPSVPRPFKQPEEFHGQQHLYKPTRLPHEHTTAADCITIKVCVGPLRLKCRTDKVEVKLESVNDLLDWTHRNHLSQQWSLKCCKSEGQ